MVVPTPNRAISANDQRKLAACAIKPFKGRPIKNPGKLIVETAANANRGTHLQIFWRGCNPVNKQLLVGKCKCRGFYS
jgi:hypothetical protein